MKITDIEKDGDFKNPKIFDSPKNSEEIFMKKRKAVKKAQKKKVIQRPKKGRSPSNKSKDAKVKKLIRLAGANAAKPKKKRWLFW